MAESDTVRSPAGDGQRRCTYCYQELNEMTDPRQLPCTHIVCLPCLENDWKLDELQCRACSKDISIESLDKLPKLQIRRLEDLPVRNTPVKKYDCDICKESSPAIIYCVDCGKKFCCTHKQSHQDFFDNLHKTVEINIFAQRPAVYTNVSCDRHPPNPIKHVCKKCDMMCCSSCLTELGLCNSGGAHQLRTLHQIMSDIRVELDPVIAQCSDKITKLCKLEKETWESVDSVNERYEAMKKRVNETTEQQISEIREEAAKLNEKIEDHKSMCLKQFESYAAQLIEGAEKLENVQVAAQIFLQNSHVTDVVKGKSQQVQYLKRTAASVDDNKIYDQQIEEKVLLPLPMSRGIEYELGSSMKINQNVKASSIKPPTTVLFSHDRKVHHGTYCRSLLHTPDGNLAVGSSQCVLLYNQSFSLQAQSAQTSSNILSLNQLGDGSILTLLHKSFDLITLSSSSLIKLNNTTLATQGLRRSTISGDLLIICGAEIKGLKVVHCRRGNFTNSIQGSAQIRSICTHPDGDICFLDTQNNKVCKYTVSECDEPKLVWTCQGIIDGYAICCDKRGLVYVTASGKKLYIIHEGTIAQTLVCSDLPDHVTGSTGEYSDISVYNNTLVTTQTQSLKLKIFKLES